MKVSESGRKKIEDREGVRLVAYRDSEGVPTIGVGHTGRMSPPKVSLGMRISREQADQFLSSDLAPVELALTKALKVPVSENEGDALVSLYFNVGVGYIPKSTIIRKLNLGDVKGAGEAFLLYNKPKEILGRRKGEMEQFLTHDPYTSAQRVASLSSQASSAKGASVVSALAAPVLGLGIPGVVLPLAPSHPILGSLLVGGGLISSLGAALLAFAKGKKATVISKNLEGEKA